LMEGTGSRLSPEGLGLYQTLLRAPGHVAGVLGMMARWDLHALHAALPSLGARHTLVVGERDRAVPPSVSRAVHRATPGSRLVVMAGLGHLAHEEDPRAAARIVLEALQAAQAHRPPSARPGGAALRRAKRQA
jgi:magnesium chelatase accessory protein